MSSKFNFIRQLYNSATAATATTTTTTTTTTDPFSNTLVFRQLHNGPNVLISKACCGKFVVLLGDVVGLNDRSEDWKPICGVQRSVIVVCVRSCQLLPEKLHNKDHNV